MKLTELKTWWAFVPTHQRKMLIVLGMIGILGVSFVILRPIYKKGSANFQKAEQLAKEVDRLKLEAKGLLAQESKIKKEASLLEGKLSEEGVKRLIISEFSTNYQKKNAAIEFVEIKPGKIQKAKKEKDKEVPAFLPLRITFRSSFETLQDYLKYLEGLQRPLKVSEMKVTLDEKTKLQLFSQLDLSLYLQPQSSDQPKEVPGVKSTQAPQAPPVEKSEGEVKGEPQVVPFAPSGIAGQGSKTTVGDLTLSLKGFIGEKALFGESLVGVGDSVQGWQVATIDSRRGEVVLVRGNSQKVLSMGVSQ
ncbi:MAG TPA: hypothetical protein VJL87_00445 [Bdellovibrionota bacterium]|nr:hypothetical protein [Bdellovibrionota bacterium]